MLCVYAAVSRRLPLMPRALLHLSLIHILNPGKNLGSESYDISKLYSQPDKRVPAGTATTADAAAAADSAD